MFTRFSFAVCLIFVMTCLSFSDDRQNQLCTMLDTSLLISTFSYYCTPDGQSKFGHEWLYSYNKEKQIVTRCNNNFTGNQRYTEYVLYTYDNDGRFMDKSIVSQSTGGDWSIKSRVTERKYNDVDTMVEDYGSGAIRYIYIKNSIGQVIELISQTRTHNAWNDRSRSTIEYDSRGNKIYSILEDSDGNLLNRAIYEYNRDNQLISFRNQVVNNGAWVDQRREIYKYDTRKRIVLYLNLIKSNDESDSVQKREYIYSRHTCNPITRTNEYEYWGGSWHLYQQDFDFSNNSGLVTETQTCFYGTDSSINWTKYKYEYDRFRNLILTEHFCKDTNGVWIKDYFETKSYSHVNSSDNQNHCNRKKEWIGLSETELYYSDPFNYDRQVAILDSKGKICQVKELKLGTTGQELDSLKEITPEQLYKLRKSKDQRIFWRGNESLLMGTTHNFR